MIAPLLVALQGATTPPPQAVTPPPIVQPAVPPVADWPALPAYPLARTVTLVEASAYVRGEAEAGRCRPLTPPQPDGARVVAPVAILVGPAGAIRRIVPRAIDCPTVEQYTVGYLLSVTRAIGGTTLPPAPGWYRLTVTYRW